ncbi:MAG TPA: hypothetical protein PKD55_22095 [Bellilinea sp.]|nr:hypothetical protein [Bellilinea sp.]
MELTLTVTKVAVFDGKITLVGFFVALGFNLTSACVGDEGETVGLEESVSLNSIETQHKETSPKMLITTILAFLDFRNKRIFSPLINSEAAALRANNSVGHKYRTRIE